MGRNRKLEPINDDYARLGERIRVLRVSQNMTQERLAQIMGISKTSMVNYETATRKMPITLIKRIALYFDVSMDDLLDIHIPNKDEQMEFYEDMITAKNLKRWFDHMGKTHLNDEEFAQLMNFAQFILQQRKDEGK